jgi:hypothetical protein
MTGAKVWAEHIMARSHDQAAVSNMVKAIQIEAMREARRIAVQALAAKGITDSTATDAIYNESLKL